MVILNPCCCISLQRGSKLVAIFDIILACVPLIVFLSNFVPGVYGDGAKAFSDFNTGIWTIFVVFLTADIGLSCLLFYAARERCIKNLKRWFYVRTVTAGAMVLLIIISACLHATIEFILYDIFYTLYRIYTLAVVYLFVGELVHEDIFSPKKQPHPDFSVAVISSAYKKDKWANENDYSYEPSSKQYGSVNGAFSNN